MKDSMAEPEDNKAVEKTAVDDKAVEKTAEDTAHATGDNTTKDTVAEDNVAEDSYAMGPPLEGDSESQ